MKSLLAHIALLLLCVLPAHSQFIYSDFSDQYTYTLVGRASIQGRQILVSPSLGAIGTAGGIWHDYPVRVDSGWTCSFTVRITNPGGQLDTYGNAGGDGFALVIQNDRRPSEVFGPIGATGGGIGYAGISNSIAIELDTYANDEPGIIDPSSNHLSVQTRGLEPNSFDHRFSLGAALDLPDLSDGNAHHITVRYAAGRLSIWVDACGAPRLVVPVVLDTLLWLDNGRAWIGITAASRAAYQNHWLSDWCFSYTTLCGCRAADTVRVDSVRHDTTYIERHDTLLVERRDTLTIHTTDTLRLVQHDTLMLTRVDTVVRSVTVEVHDTTIVRSADTVTLALRDTVVRFDTIPCDTPTIPQPDCDGTFRQIEPMEFWRGIIAVDPNPGAGRLRVVYELPADGPRIVRLFTVSGAVALILQQGSGPAGRVEFEADVSDLPSGVYILRLDAEADRQTPIHYHRIYIQSDRP